MSHLEYEINKELGECYLFMGDLDKAEEYYNKAAGSNGVHPDPYMGLATIAVQRGDLATAHAFYGKAAALEETDKALAGLGLVEMELGQNAPAFGHFLASVARNPENVISLYGLIRLGHALNRLAEVVPHLAAYLERDPEKHDIRYSLAGCLMCLDRKDEAMVHVKHILAGDPDNEAARELYSQMLAA
jgi:tetratricopeptide (TPR) repeat protein